MLRTYQPKKLHRKKEHGFKKRCLHATNVSSGASQSKGQSTFNLLMYALRVTAA